VHDIDTLATGNFTGKLIADTGVPGGTSTVNANGAPPTSRTVTVHGSAEAGGNHANPATVANAPATSAAGRRKLKFFCSNGRLSSPAKACT
jgi:hypothetical protein